MTSSYYMQPYLNKGSHGIILIGLAFKYFISMYQHEETHEGWDISVRMLD